MFGISAGFLQMDLLRVLQLLNPIRTHTIFFSCASYGLVFLNLIYTLAVKNTTSIFCSVLYNKWEQLNIVVAIYDRF
jgi:hypothetical protein